MSHSETPPWREQAPRWVAACEYVPSLHFAVAPVGSVFDAVVRAVVATGADALLVVTEWDEFSHLDLDRLKGLMRRPVIVDGRNIFDPKTMRDRGFVYRGVGRS